MLGKLEEDLVLSMGRQRNGQVLSSEEYQLLRGGLPAVSHVLKMPGNTETASLIHVSPSLARSSKGSRTGGPVP